MGAWGIAAWDNDSAADWFGDMFDATGLAKNVEEALQRDVEDEHAEVRAAAHVLVALGRVYIWPIEELDRHLELAITKLEAMKSLEIYQDVPKFVTAIDEEISVLQKRMKPRSQ